MVNKKGPESTLSIIESCLENYSWLVFLQVQILEQLKSQLEKRVDELEASNQELESKLSYYQGGKLSEQELMSGGEEGYPPSPRGSLCTPPASPKQTSPAFRAQVSCPLYSSFFYLLDHNINTTPFRNFPQR